MKDIEVTIGKSKGRMVNHTSEEMVKEFALGVIKETNGTYSGPFNTLSICQGEGN